MQSRHETPGEVDSRATRRIATAPGADDRARRSSRRATRVSIYGGP
ncbi:hypothetical protein ACFQGT_15170 [Natrialbaceae archaeon GCM10025810]